MAAFSRGKSGIKSIYVPMREGFVQRSTGTSNPQLVRAMKRMVEQLKDDHRWVILDAIRDSRRWTPPGQQTKQKLTLAVVYEYFASNRIATLEALLSAKNLSEYLDDWIAWVRADRRDDVRTADVYWQQVTTLVPVEGAFLAPELTKERVKQWLVGIEATSGTRRKYLYALKSFVRYLVDAGVYREDPLAGLIAPKKNPPRERWEPADVDQRIVAAAAPKYRALFAFIKATGCDVGSAFRAVRRDLDLERGKAQIRGTKTDRRKVHDATIEAWALPYLREHCSGLLPNAPLWPTGKLPKAGALGRAASPFYSLSGANHHHARCCEAVGVEDYTLKDARHSVGVRMRKAGATFEAIAEQLGTSVYQAVTVYTRYRPEAEEATGARAARGG